MRVNIVGQGGHSSSGLSINGATMTGPLTLAANPVAPLEAATKQYVDLAGNSLDASKITTGTLAVGRMPAFIGDLSSAAGNNVLTLSNTGVVAGTYTKVTVGAQGRVTGTSNITAADVPNLDWSKVTSGKPTTLSGYGITDGVSVNGDSVTGHVNAHANPTSGLQLATKQYVDNKTDAGGVIPAGTTIRRTSTTTPVGYLRCNGALASKTTYPALYAIFGDNVVSQYNSMPGAGQPWRQQYGINDVQSGSITGWVSSTGAPNVTGGAQVVVTKNRAYLIGGYTSGLVPVSTVYTATINPDGTIGGWTAGPSLPSYLEWGQAIVTKNRVYAIGAGDGDLVYTSVVNTDGTLAGWTTATALPVRLVMSQAIVTKSYVYLLGGANITDSLPTVCVAPINADGTLGAWTTGTSLPGALGSSQAIVTKNRVYLLGGHAGGAYRSTVYTAPINSDGTLGAWVTGTPLPINVGYSHTCVTTNRVYLMGGGNSDTAFSSVYSAPINADGTIGSWVVDTPLPFVLADGTVAVTQSRVHIINALNNFDYSSRSISAPFSGGLNDYSTLYTTGYTAVDPDNFRLPDTTTTDTGGLYSYIKT